MPYITMIGFVAAICSTVSFLPQAWKVIRTRDIKGISAGMYSLTVAAFAFWTLYGVLLGKWPLILSNGLCLVTSAFILMMTLLPKKKRAAVAKTIAK